MPIRKKHTAADFVLSRHADQYDVAIIQVLIKHFGVKYTMDILQEVAEIRKEQAQPISELKKTGLETILPSKEKQYYNTLLIQDLVMYQDLPDKIKGAFYADCTATLSRMTIPRSWRKAPDQQKYTEEQISEIATICCFRTCFYLAFIQGLSECAAIVKRINSALQQGYYQAYMNDETTQWQDASLRQQMGLKDLIVSSTKAEVGPKMFKEIKRQYGVDAEKRKQSRRDCGRCQNCLLHGRGEDIKNTCDEVESIVPLETID